MRRPEIRERHDGCVGYPRLLRGVDAQDGRLRHAAPVPDGRRESRRSRRVASSLAVGALCWQSRQPEFYTSQGPTIDGRMKPDRRSRQRLGGYVRPFSSCPSGFAGVRGCARGGRCRGARQAGVPRLRSDQLQQYLVKNALDMGAAGMDSVTGAGELQLPRHRMSSRQRPARSRARVAPARRSSSSRPSRTTRAR